MTSKKFGKNQRTIFGLENVSITKLRKKMKTHEKRAKKIAE
jgi:hypothetical protein